jgi:hypothetical protein
MSNISTPFSGGCACGAIRYQATAEQVLGDITNARGTEMFLALWVRLWGVLEAPHFNIHVVRGE